MSTLETDPVDQAGSGAADEPVWAGALLPTDAELLARYTAAGWWDGSTLASAIVEAFSRNPSSPVRVHSAEHPYEGTYADVLSAARSLAQALRARGVGQGDTVAFQLPNWSESLVCFAGIALSGATLVPIASYYREKELRHILSRSRAVALVIPRHFRGRDYLAEAEALRGDLPALRTVAVVGDGPLPSWATSFADLVAGAADEQPVPAVDPGSPAAIAWTSGTTSDPKGVLMSHRALVSEVRHHIVPSQPGTLPRLGGAPLAHVTGMLAVGLAPAFRGVGIHLVDIWDPARVLAIMAEFGLPPGLYAPVFATSLLDHPDCTPALAALMGAACLGGAPVPGPLVERLERAGVVVARGYGSTEHPSITLSLVTDPEVPRLTTEGAVQAGVEVRIVDEEERDVPFGSPGEVLSRGPDLFSGYLDPSTTADAVAPGGWLRTGDIGVLSRHGDADWLAIVDRKKDIVIRAGINISSAEVEGALSGMPGIAEVAVIGVPDESVGERAAAVVHPFPGQTITLDDIRSHLTGIGMAKQKWPERLITSDEPLPRTASGKIRKPDLRRLARDAD
ncbi:putative Long-chain-fatty-acid--CoA ligase [Frankia canadensis]|uniref:Putative Long-chain-fatty-acid--CoA ligase n=1 Tax=Frankia canadensis TaxID=1836972 RepID=A0A2I2KRR8_9ACTN|nr:AMP-binding protein [Frankia canadensis]SNQ48368.1 putative Long-chain-fatty-acid--CoA ligase [Frankia canadensis]SOU55658.1 putative Long-chain-fatty-acid--CoA ligase [Frankia canadensis]